MVSLKKRAYTGQKASILPLVLHNHKNLLLQMVFLLCSILGKRQRRLLKEMNQYLIFANRNWEFVNTFYRARLCNRSGVTFCMRCFPPLAIAFSLHVLS